MICLTSVESYRILDFYVRDLSNIRQILLCTRSTYVICLTSEVLNVDLTRLASDPGQARQKYHRTVQKYLCTVHILDGLRHAHRKQRESLPPEKKVNLSLRQSFCPSVRAKRGIWSKRVCLRTNGNLSFSVC